jgi:hypothetical protein
VRPARLGAACDTLAVDGLSGENAGSERGENTCRPRVAARVRSCPLRKYVSPGDSRLGTRSPGTWEHLLRNRRSAVEGEGWQIAGTPSARTPARGEERPSRRGARQVPLGDAPNSIGTVSMSSRSHQGRPAAQRGMDARDLASPCTAGELPGRLPRLGRRPVGGTSLVRTVEGRVRVLPLLRARRSVAVLARNPGHCPGGSSVIGAAARGDAGSP